MMKKIIINADDFGINEEVTSEIKAAITNGVISSTTVMANGLCLKEVEKFSADHPEVSYGIHLCLSEFDSLTKSESLYKAGLTDENGRFIRKAIFHIKNFKDADVRRSIKEELNAQIDVVSSLGFKISHADSHHHIHTIYPLKDIIADVLQTRGIHKVRIEESFQTWRSRRHIALWLQQLLVNRFYSTRFITTNAFYSYNDYLKYGIQYSESIVELMCHPGHSALIYRKEMESVYAKKALMNDEIQLISYNDIY